MGTAGICSNTRLFDMFMNPEKYKQEYQGHWNGPSENTVVQEYIEKYLELAQYTDMQYNIPASITLAQAIIESASGTSELAVKGNNHFGIKYFKGTYYLGAHWNGWKVYQTVRESYIDHALFFHNNPQCEWPFGKDYKAWAKVLYVCKYAGDSPEYETEILRIVEQYNLTQYDR